MHSKFLTVSSLIFMLVIFFCFVFFIFVCRLIAMRRVFISMTHYSRIFLQFGNYNNHIIILLYSIIVVNTL